jgi:hypothetical protein
LGAVYEKAKKVFEGLNMEDKEVGKLWVDIWRDEDPVGPHGYCRNGIIKLIRKLVEEATKYEEERGFLTQGRDMTLRRFGIDPKTWK